ncbi:MAG: dynamin family protein [Bacillota bacterium]
MLSDTIEDLCGIAARYDCARLKESLWELRALFQRDILRVVVVGEFKKGKSTFINAILGEELLPTGVVPLTSTITVIRYSNTRYCHVHFENGTTAPAALSQIADYVTEAGNPGNAKGVSFVEIGIPSSVLGGDFLLVDTPGISSVFEQNTEETRKYLDRVDVAIVVLSIDPPVTRDELNLVKEVSAYAGRLLFVLNKIDRFSREQVEESGKFTRSILRATLGDEAHIEIYPVSSLDALRGKSEGDNSLYEKSGMKELEERIESLRTHEKTGIVMDAAARKVASSAKALESVVRLTRATLVLPQETLREAGLSMNRFFEKLKKEKELHLFRLKGRGETLTRELNDRWQDFEIRAVADLKRRLRCLADTTDSVSLAVLDERLKRLVREHVPELLEQWQRSMEAWLQDTLNALGAEVLADMNELLSMIDEETQRVFSTSFQGIQADATLLPDPRLYLDYSETVAFLLPGADRFVRFLPQGIGRGMLVSRYEQRACALLRRNAGRIRHSLAERIARSVGEFREVYENQIEERKVQILAIISSSQQQLEKEKADTKARLEQVDADLAAIERMRERQESTAP